MNETFVKRIFKSLFDGFVLWRNNNHTNVMIALRTRATFAIVCCFIIFAGITYKLVNVMIISQFMLNKGNSYTKEEIVRKADIVDRNGELLATSLITSSCYADPSVVIDIDETARKLSEISGLPSYETIRKKLSNKEKHFVWIARHVHPKIQEQIMDFGLPGIKFQRDYKRVYIHGNLFAHTVGYTDIDGVGMCGLERAYSDKLQEKKSINRKLVTTLDIRLQSIIHEELSAAIKKYNAIGGNAMLMTIDGEILSMVSLPDFDPNDLRNIKIEHMFNRNTLGVFEHGSIFKILNVAIALDSGSSGLGSIFDASSPIKIGRYKITDFKGKNRPLTLAEAFVYSSNIASAKIALNFGAKLQKSYMTKFGMLDKPEIELLERGHSIFPVVWNDMTCISVSYGYGIAVTPLQTLTAVTSIVNGGTRVHPTLLYSKATNKNTGERIVSTETSAMIRELMRAVVCFGTGKKADVIGESIIGKTGTAYKSRGKGYGADGKKQRITTFIGGFPKDTPQYMLLISLDEPKATSETHGYATAGWNIAPTAHNVFARIIPILSDGNHQEETPLKVTRYLK